MTASDSMFDDTPAPPRQVETRVIKPLQTVVYVTEGKSLLRWDRRLEHEAELESADGEPVSNDSDTEPSAPARRHRSISLTLLAGSAVVGLAGALLGAPWLWEAERGWPVLLPAAVIALIGVLDIVWACRARAARYPALVTDHSREPLDCITPRSEALREVG
jgi:hypothetical protein